MPKKETDHMSMAPCLLLAIPQLHDPNFRKSVVLLVENQPEGSVGLVLNHPTEMAIKPVLEGLSIEWRGDPEATVWDGGPVLKEQGWVLHSQPHSSLQPSAVEISEGIFLSGTSDQLKQLAFQPPEQTRFLLGSAGWGEDQLESEIAQGWWLTLEVELELVFHTPWDQIWEKAFRSMGIDPGNFAFNSSTH